MRKLLIAAAVALIGLMPMSASAQLPAGEQPYTYGEDVFYPLFLAVGAVAGVVGVNLLTSGYVGVIPWYTGITSPVNAPVADMTATALSRVYAVTGVIVGGWIANWLYTGE